MTKRVNTDKKVVKKIKPKIFSVDIRKFVLLTSEVDRDSIFQMAEKFGFKINNPLSKYTGLFTLDAMNVPVDKFDETLDKINQVKDEVKKQQIDFYDENKEQLSVDSKMLELVSKFLSKAKKDPNADVSKLQMVLSTILGDLYQIEEHNIRFLDEETIEQLARATVSDTLDKTKTHLNKALINTLIQIRKLAILWFFESISLDLYNVRIDREEIHKLQESKEIKFRGKKYEIIPVTINNKSYRLAYSETEYSLTTFNVGIKNQNLIIPVLSAIFIDKASLNWRLNYSKIIIKAISRLKDQTEHQIKNLILDYNEINVEDLLFAEHGTKESFEFLFQLLFNYKNQLQTENQAIRRHYKREYSRELGSMLGGAISNAVRKVTPLDLLDEFNQLVYELEKTMKEISDLKFQVVSILKELVKAKKEENPSLFKKAAKKLQEVGENITAKTLAELLDKMLNK